MNLFLLVNEASEKDHRMYQEKWCMSNWFLLHENLRPNTAFGTQDFFLNDSCTSSAILIQTHPCVTFSYSCLCK